MTCAGLRCDTLPMILVRKIRRSTENRVLKGTEFDMENKCVEGGDVSKSGNQNANVYRRNSANRIGALI